MISKTVNTGECGSRLALANAAWTSSSNEAGPRHDDQCEGGSTWRDETLFSYSMCLVGWLLVSLLVWLVGGLAVCLCVCLLVGLFVWWVDCLLVCLFVCTMKQANKETIKQASKRAKKRTRQQTHNHRNSDTHANNERVRQRHWRKPTPLIDGCRPESQWHWKTTRWSRRAASRLRTRPPGAR